MECVDDGLDRSGVPENATISVQEVLLTFCVVAGATSRFFLVFDKERDEAAVLETGPTVNVAGRVGQGIAIRFRLGERGGIDNALSIDPPENTHPRFYFALVRSLLHRLSTPARCNAIAQTLLCIGAVFIGSVRAVVCEVLSLKNRAVLFITVAAPEAEANISLGIIVGEAQVLEHHRWELDGYGSRILDDLKFGWSNTVFVLGTGTEFDRTIKVVAFFRRAVTDASALGTAAPVNMAADIAEMLVSHLCTPRREGTVSRARDRLALTNQKAGVSGIAADDTARIVTSLVVPRAGATQYLSAVIADDRAVTVIESRRDGAGDTMVEITNVFLLK